MKRSFFKKFLPFLALALILTVGIGTSLAKYVVSDKNFGSFTLEIKAKLPTPVLANGSTFNAIITENAPDIEAKVIFGRYKDYENEVGSWDDSDVFVDEAGAGTIRMFPVADTIYVLFQGETGDQMKLNADSSYMFYTEDDFYGMTMQLQSITGLDCLDAGDVTTVSSIFEGCSLLTNLDGMEHWNISSLTDMSYMFYQCSSLDLEPTGILDWDTSQVTDMQGIFVSFGPYELDLSGWDTSSVTNMDTMFDCSQVTALNLSGWDTSKVETMFQMFSNCLSLTALDLSDWDTSNVEIMYRMFANSVSLTTIYVGDGWSTDSVTSSEEMFSGSTSLKGGAGTTYDKNHIDASYARIDGGTSAPGYFTGKAEAASVMMFSPRPAASISSISQFFQSHAALPDGTIQEKYMDYVLDMMPSDFTLSEWDSQLTAHAAKDGDDFYGWRIYYGNGSEICTHDQLKGFLVPLYAENPSLHLLLRPLYKVQ